MKKVIKNEKQFSDWFIENYKKLVYDRIIRSDISRFPDFIMLKDGKEIRVELETVSSNFILHKHDINKVDEIVCLINDIEFPKPIIEVRELEYSGKEKVTLSIEDSVYDEFRKYCEDNALMLSGVVEKIMLKELKRRNGDD